MKTKFIIPLILFILCSTNVMAEGQSAGNNSHWTLGIGAVYSDSPYRGMDNEMSPFPQISYRGERFFLRGTQLGFNLVKDKGVTLSMIGNYRLQGYDSSDSSFLQGMNDRENTLEAGMSAALQTHFGQIKLSILSDLMNEHNGQEIRLSLLKRYRFNKWIFTPSLSARWQSNEMVDYYYGVTQAEATVNRSSYEADSSIIFQFGILANYMMTDNWFLTGRLSTSLLPDEITKSPIVNNDITTNGFMGISYRF